MLGTHDVWAFFLASLVLWITPGPDNMYILARSVAQGRRAGVYRQGVVSNILNPRVAVFFLAFLPQFVDAGSGWGPLPFLLLGGLFVTGGTLWCALLALGAASATSTLRRSPRLLGSVERLSGCVYIALGLNLLRSRPQNA
jgi:threonine/homoserine/homoserine lactone efflux protein